MSIIMDQEMITDLFGDQGAVQLPSIHVVRGLNERLDQLSGSSCCQRVAYSKEGVVAAIDADSKSINVQVLKRDPKTSRWNLTKSHNVVPDQTDSASIVHISWSPLGNELAVVDDSGRVRVYRNHPVLGRMKLQHESSLEGLSDVTAAAGLFWLNVTPHYQMTGICWSASRSGSNWNYELKNHLTPLGTTNPLLSQNSFLMLTKSGELKLFMSLLDGQWLERVITLDGALEAGSIITHAAFALQPRDPFILVAVHDVSRRLKVYRVLIQWNYKPPEQASKDNPQPQPPAAPNPVIDAQPLIVERNCAPSFTDSVDHNGNAVMNTEHTPSSQLLHLDFVPFLPDKPLHDPWPTIIATFVTYNPSTILGFDPMQRYANASSVVCRWHFKSRPEISQSLMAVFDDLRLPKPPPTTQDAKSVRAADIKKDSFSLDRMADVYLHSIVMSQSILRAGTLMSFAMIDGSIEFRFRDSMELASADGNYEEVSTLPQFGFAFAAQEPALYIALSSNFCCAITLDQEGKVSMRTMQSPEDLSQLKEDQRKHTDLLDQSFADFCAAQFGALCALIATCLTSSMISYAAFDDILAVLPRKLSSILANSISEQLMVACAPLGGRLDFTQSGTPELMNFITKGSSARQSLSFHNAASPLSKGKRAVGADLCWSILNLRIVWTNLSVGLRDENNWRPEVALSLSGNTRYFWAILGYMLNELANIAYHLGDKSKDREALEQYIAENRTPALHLLLCSLPRRLLRVFCQVIFRQYTLTTKKLSELRGPPTQPVKDGLQMRQWQQFMSTYKQSPLLALVLQEKSPLDTWLSKIDASISECYGQQASRDDRQRAEAGMLVRCNIDERLMPAVRAIFENLDGLQRFYDPGALYRYETDWLGLGIQSSTSVLANGARGTRKRTYDVLRKTELMAHTPVKMCPRCGSMTEEFEPGVPVPFWMAHVAKSCVCGVLWAVADGPEAINGANGVASKKAKTEAA